MLEEFFIYMEKMELYIWPKTRNRKQLQLDYILKYEKQNYWTFQR